MRKLFTLTLLLFLIPALSSAQDLKAKRVRIQDIGLYYTGTEVETALQEIGTGTTFDGKYLKLDASNDPLTGSLEGTDATFTGTGTFNNFISAIATGTSPYACTSTTLNANLNADLWDGYQFADYLDQDVKTTSSPTFVEATLSGLTLGSIPFAGVGGVISQDNAKLFWDNTNKRLGINKIPTQGTLDVAGQIYATSRFQLTGNDGSTPYFVMSTYSNTGWHANFFILQRSRGTYASKLPVVSGDNVFRYTMKGWDGATMVTGAEIRSKVDGTVSSGITPMQFVFRTQNAAGVLADRMILKPSGNFGINDLLPAEKLDVNGNINVTGVYKVDDVSGLSATYAFGGGGSGDIASMTFAGGILTAVTTVP